jgi:hypothetical protein
MGFHQIDEQALLGYADGALDPARQAEVAALLAEHPELQAELDELRRLQRGLRAAFDAADLLPAPPPTAWEHIARRTTRYRPRWLNLAVGAGAMLIIVVVFALLRGQEQHSTIAAPTTAPVAVEPTTLPNTTVSVGLAPTPIAMTLADARRSLPFPVFVPTALPSNTNLVPYLPKLDGQVLTIDYAGKVLLINGPAGCCLDADPRKSGDTLTLANRITAHFLEVEPQYGGPILWWQQEGTYIAISGPQLRKDVLIYIAASMSKTADFSAAVALPPPGPEGVLPSGRIAFAMLRDPIADGGCGRLGVYVLNSGTRQPTYLADGCSPVLSPDTRLVAYTRGGHIFVKSADGGPEVKVTGTLGGINPTWSPDGKRLAFSADADNKSQIYIVNADGSQLTRITKSSTDLAAGRLGSDPIWSPDGRRIAFTVSPDFPLTNANWDVYVVEIAGSGLMRLTDNPARDGLIDWSPDGTKILFWSERDSGKTNIYVMNADGSNQKQLTNGKFDDSANWSPDGKRIVFVSGNDRQLYVMNVDGSERARLTENLGNIFNPVWSPDSQYLIFASFSDIWQASALYMINADGSQLARLITTTQFLQWAQR